MGTDNGTRSGLPPVRFSKEQLHYLKKLLAIAPCHITGEHTPNHHLDGIICDDQRADAWKYAMIELGFDPDRPERVLHNGTCGWCHPTRKGPSNADLHEAWALDVLQLPSWFSDDNKAVHREVWWLKELPNITGFQRANLKQFLRARKYPAPEDCNPETCPKKNIGWCPSKKCVIARDFK